jgi:phosphonate transport system substrate-binding protein
VESNSNVEPGQNFAVPDDSMPKSARLLKLLAIAIFLTAIIGLIFWAKFVRSEPTDNTPTNLITTGFSNGSPHTLSPQFKDVNGNGFADPPTDPSQFIDPPKLVWCFVATDDAAQNKQDWKPFTDYLSKVTGKPVDYLLVTSTHDELQAMQNGQLQVAGFNTGAVPPAVNISGFIPVCSIPTHDGTALTHTDIIVPADSSMQSPEDLKGHELTLTDLGSNTGYKAPLVLLRDQYNLQPLSDIRLRYSGSHNVSIAGIVSRRYEAAAVADDMLTRQIVAGNVTPSQIRVIYKSENFPTAGLGYVYNLKPELAQKVRDALLSFDWKGTSLENLLDSGTQTKFIPVSYKNDWTLVRKIDDQMGVLSGF